MMNKNQIYLCGTVHIDILGPKRLKKVLEFIRPSCVAIESYEELTKEIVENHNKWTKIPGEKITKLVAERLNCNSSELNSETVKNYVNMLGYEIWTSVNYVRKTGARLFHLEDSNVTKEFVEKIMSDIPRNEAKAEMMKNFLAFQMKDFVSISNAIYQMPLREKEANETKTTERNIIFAEKIEKIEGRTLAVVGTAHIFGEQPNLVSLLRPHSPIAFELRSIDYLENMQKKAIKKGSKK